MMRGTFEVAPSSLVMVAGSLVASGSRAYLPHAASMPSRQRLCHCQHSGSCHGGSLFMQTINGISGICPQNIPCINSKF
ncbi:uncharacterized protein BDV14DRAFT_164581 [Aspergillus stella-maris]|uniref:uncharacterized protein n=1 Tax=Aspergillus stella-maris TaxID=1810926 RepID=UPI003CCDBFA6